MKGLTVDPKKIGSIYQEALQNAFFKDNVFKFFKFEFDKYFLDSEKLTKELGVNSPKKVTIVGDFKIYTFTSNNFFNGGIIVLNGMSGQVAVVSNFSVGKISHDIICSSKSFEIEILYFAGKTLLDDVMEEMDWRKPKKIDYGIDSKNILRLILQIKGTYSPQTVQRMSIIFSFIIYTMNKNDEIGDTFYLYFKSETYMEDLRNIILSTNSLIGHRNYYYNDNLKIFNPNAFIENNLSFLFLHRFEKKDFDSENFVMLYHYVRKKLIEDCINVIKKERINQPSYSETLKEICYSILSEFDK